MRHGLHGCVKLPEGKLIQCHVWSTIEVHYFCTYIIDIYIDEIWQDYITLLGKSWCFSTLNFVGLFGDDFPLRKKNDSRVENRVRSSYLQATEVAGNPGVPLGNLNSGVERRVLWGLWSFPKWCYMEASKMLAPLNDHINRIHFDRIFQYITAGKLT